MFPFEEILFALAFLMALVWLACLARISRMLRERHPGKYAELDLEHMWPHNLMGWVRGFDNSGPVKAFLRFLWRREYYGTRDDEVARLGAFMRDLFAAYVVLFVVLAGSIVHDSLRAQDARDNVRPAASAEDRRAEAYRLHNEKKWAEAVVIYDELLGEAGADAEVVYWRGMARWHLRRDDEALVDFRRVMDLDPGNIDAYRNSDRILSAQKRFDDCVDLWSRYLRVVPGDAEAHYQRGGAHFRRGDIAAAHADATRACELGKGEACPLVERMKALMSAGAAPQR